MCDHITNKYYFTLNYFNLNHLYDMDKMRSIIHSISDSLHEGKNIAVENFEKNLQSSINQARNPPPDTTALGRVVQATKAEQAQLK